MVCVDAFVVLKSKSIVCFELLIELRVWFELHPFDFVQKAWFVLSFSEVVCKSDIRLILLYLFCFYCSILLI